jgi:cytochrome d ubiquinol oxidase subunit I
MAVVAICVGVVVLRRRSLQLRPTDRWALLALIVISPFGFVATEAGWFTTEVGRQPWIVFGVLRTRNALTPMPGLVVPFVLVTLLYFGLGAVVVWLLWRQIVRTSGESPALQRPGAVERR